MILHIVHLKMTIESINFRLERHGNHPNVKCAIVKRVSMGVPKHIVNYPKGNHGIQMATYAKSASVVIKMGNTSKNVQRPRVRHAKS